MSTQILGNTQLFFLNLLGEQKLLNISFSAVSEHATYDKYSAQTLEP